MKKIDLFIIDDSELNNLVTEKIASQNSRINDISKFTNATEALDRMMKLSNEGGKLPDLILLDIQMPEMEGYKWRGELDECFDNSELTEICVSGTSYQKEVKTFNMQSMTIELLQK